MIPILTLIVAMSLVLMLGTQDWRSKLTRFLLISMIALLEALLLLFDMFTMKIPKP